ncbi:hypothetical protein BLX87_16300 [Bacillus sp. VT-16-64]|nr:hypothetical protein BLX87_16300 [Bacillus sp. VT-16-64]
MRIAGSHRLQRIRSALQSNEFPHGELVEPRTALPPIKNPASTGSESWDLGLAVGFSLAGWGTSIVETPPSAKSSKIF